MNRFANIGDYLKKNVRFLSLMSFMDQALKDGFK